MGIVARLHKGKTPVDLLESQRASPASPMKAREQIDLRDLPVESSTASPE